MTRPISIHSSPFLVPILFIILDCSYFCYCSWHFLMPQAHAFIPSTKVLSSPAKLTTTPSYSSTDLDTRLLATTTNRNDGKLPLEELSCGIIGGGPSGCLLAHKLLQLGASITIYEQHSMPTYQDPNRSHVFGLGVRGKSAISQSPIIDHDDHVDEDSTLWTTIQKSNVGLDCHKFHMHLKLPFLDRWLQVKLRDEKPGIEPTTLCYCTDLCRAMIDELNSKWKDSGRLQILFDHQVQEIDFHNKDNDGGGDDGGGVSVTSIANRPTATATEIIQSFDFVAGCDGINSTVRKRIDDVWTEFKCSEEKVPGVYKMAHLSEFPSTTTTTTTTTSQSKNFSLDPTSVHGLVGGLNGIITVVEPTNNSNKPCFLLFLGTNEKVEEDVLFKSDNTTLLEETLTKRYSSKLKHYGVNMTCVAQQLAATKTAISSGSNIRCNTYNYADKAVLIGDSAHGVGGGSGQGLNAALVDTVRLVDCLLKHYKCNEKDEGDDSVDKENTSSSSSLRRALLSYSKCAVPEGLALYDLATGPPKPTTKLAAMSLFGRKLRDALFAGRWGIGKAPIHTLLTTSIQPFAEIRRERAGYYEESFPDPSEWNTLLDDLDKTAKV